MSDSDIIDYSWSSSNVTYAILISIGAGLATGIGGAVAFLPDTFARFSPAVILSVALSLSAGVMLYVSFIEIFVKAHDAILSTNPDSPIRAAAFTTTFFFLGMLFCVFLEMVVHRVGRVAEDKAKAKLASNTSQTTLVDVEVAVPKDATAEGGWQGKKVAVADKVAVAEDCCTDEGCNAGAEGCGSAPAKDGREFFSRMDPCGHDHGGGECKDGGMDQQAKAELGRMGILTGLAIALHNFPEGLATFLATVTDVSSGAALGTAIAIHNIPEGVCVAMPIYYATGSKWKAFGWSVMSGVTEPIGGIVGYAILQPVFTQFVYGCVFAMVGGMMVFIVLHELLPTAHRYMPGKTGLVSGMLVLGMVIMSISLVLFTI